MSKLNNRDLLKRLWSGDYSGKSKEKLCQELNKYSDELYPYCSVPNVSEFKIKELSEYHPILKKEGIKKRVTGPEIEYAKGSNRNMNRYLKHMFIQLNKIGRPPPLPL